MILGTGYLISLKENTAATVSAEDGYYAEDEVIKTVTKTLPIPSGEDEYGQIRYEPKAGTITKITNYTANEMYDGWYEHDIDGHNVHYNPSTGNP